jgi:hypothetical protein
MGPSIIVLLAFLLLFGGFLTLLSFLALAAARSFRSNAETDKGHGCLGGCLLGIVLLFLGFLGVIAFVLFAAGTGAISAVGSNPIESITIDGEEVFHRLERGRIEPVHPLLVSVEVRGELGGLLVERVHEICRLEGVDMDILNVYRDEVRDLDTYELRLNLTDHDAEEFERELRDALGPDFQLEDLPQVRIDFRDGEPR